MYFSNVFYSVFISLTIDVPCSIDQLFVVGLWADGGGFCLGDGCTAQ